MYVCPVCEGEGSHVYPSGAYPVKCETCSGDGEIETDLFCSVCDLPEGTCQCEEPDWYQRDDLVEVEDKPEDDDRDTDDDEPEIEEVPEDELPEDEGDKDEPEDDEIPKDAEDINEDRDEDNED